jgi:hypothetical protein
MKTRDGPDSFESGNSQKGISLTAERQRLFVRITTAGGEIIADWWYVTASQRVSVRRRLGSIGLGEPATRCSYAGSERACRPRKLGHKTVDTLGGFLLLTKPLRGCSSVGRALEWHSRGEGFDSPQLHQKKMEGLGSRFPGLFVFSLRFFPSPRSLSPRKALLPFL